MKFKFAGGSDVPEWILSEVAVLSKISCVRLKLITRQVINELTGGRIDVDKVCKLAPKESGFEPSDIRATLAAIRWILASATRYSVDETVLNNELQQLGLPKENSDGLSRPFRIHRDRLLAQAVEGALRLPRLVSLGWHADAVLYDSAIGDLRGGAAAARGGARQQQPSSPVPVLHLRLGLSHPLSGAYPGFPASGAADTPLLVAHKGAATEAGPAAASPLFAVGMRPLLSGLSNRVPALLPQAELDFSLSLSQLQALVAELGAARGALAELSAAALAAP